MRGVRLGTRARQLSSAGPARTVADVLSDGPVHDPKFATPDPERYQQPEDGIAVCLSGGGFRAMLFHLGALWRLNELGYLPKLDRVSSVSGGSITAGVLGLAWPSFSFDPHGVATNF